MCLRSHTQFGNKNQREDRALKEEGNKKIEKPYATLFHSIDYKNLFFFQPERRSRCKMLRKMEKRVVVAVRLFPLFKFTAKTIMWSHDMRASLFSCSAIFVSLLVASVCGRHELGGLSTGLSWRITVVEKSAERFPFSHLSLVHYVHSHANPNIQMATLLFGLLFFLCIFINISAAGAHNARPVNTLQTYNNLLNIINVNNQLIQD